MKTGKGFPCFAALGAALFIGGPSSVPVHAAQNPEPPRVEFSRAADRVLISFLEVWPELAEQDLQPLVRVHGDGRVLVHRPWYLKQSGTFETWLTGPELDGLMNRIAPTLIEFDETVAKRELERQTTALSSGGADPAAPLLFTVEDATISYFELEVDAYGAGGAGAMEALSRPVIVAWEALEQDAERVAPHHALRALDAVRRSLHELTLRDDLTPVARSAATEPAE